MADELVLKAKLDAAEQQCRLVQSQNAFLQEVIRDQTVVINKLITTVTRQKAVAEGGS